MTDKNSPAFPATLDGLYPKSPRAFGLTKREWFAGLAMQGLLAADTDLQLSEREIARHARNHADKLIEELSDDAGK